MTETNSDLIFVSLLLMLVLLSWSLVWIVLSIYKIRQDNEKKVFWQTNLFWNLVNLMIACISIYTTAKLEFYSIERAVLMINLVAINIVLDLVYIILAVHLRKSSKVLKQQVGSGLLVQGTFLLVLDIAIVIVFQQAIN